MYGRLAAQFVDTSHGMSSVADEGADLEGELDISGLGVRQQTHPRSVVYENHPSNIKGPHTSTASKMAKTKTSRAEFLHPTTTPLWSDRGRSAGQNTRIKPSFSGMSDSRDAVNQLKRTPSS